MVLPSSSSNSSRKLKLLLKGKFVEDYYLVEESATAL